MEFAKPPRLLPVVLLASCMALSGCDEEEVSTGEFHGTAEAVPVTGPGVPGVESFDAAIKPLLKEWNVAGVTIAVAKDGQLLLVRGYGYADAESRQSMQPDATMRIASISKTITAIAVLQLKDQGRLSLDDKVFDILSDYRVPPDGDGRIRDITIRHLLQHAGGWDANVVGDPLHQNTINTGMFEAGLRVTCADLIEAHMSRPLQFTPGARARYSNFGFCVLGRIIERITNMPYEVYVRDHVLAPMDIHAMSIGYERMSERGPFEPKYYAFDGERKVQSVLPGEGLVAGPYGGHDLAAIDSTGGWIASAIDLARVLMAVENVVSADSYAEMIAGPHIPDDYGSESHWEGLGVVVGPISTTWSKSGGLSGTQSLVVHDDRRGYSWVYLANSRPERSNDFQQAMIGAIQRGLEAHASAGVGDSAVDLFPQYPSPFLPARHR